MATKLTALDMTTMVRRALGNSPTDEVENAVLLDAINLVYREVCQSYNHPELDSTMSLSTTAGNENVTLTVATENIKRLGTPINTTSGQVLVYIERDQWDWRERGQAAAGSPFYYHFHPSGTANYMALHLWPIPDAVYAIRLPYDQMPTDLVLSPAETSTLLAPQWDQAIVFGATANVAAMLGDFERARYFESKYDKACKLAFPGTQLSSEAPWRIRAVRP